MVGKTIMSDYTSMKLNTDGNYTTMGSNLKIDNPNTTERKGPLLGVSVHHLCTVFQPEAMLYVGHTLKGDTSYGITMNDIEMANLPTVNTGSGITIGGFIRQKSATFRSKEDGEMGASYVDTLDGEDHVGIVTHMLSYTWGNTLDDITQSLMHFCETSKLETKRTYIWLCALCVNQHRTITEGIWKNQCITMEQQMIEIQNILCLITMPTNTNTNSTTNNTEETTATTTRNTNTNLAMTTKPLYLNRVWCIYELYIAITKDKCKVSMIMPPKQKEVIMNAIRKSPANSTNPNNTTTSNILSTLLTSYNTTQIEYAETSQAEDKAMILRLIHNTTNGGGTARVNHTVNTYMKQWIDEVMIEETIQQAENESLNVTKNNASATTNDVELAILYNNIGLIYNNANNTNAANTASNTINGEQQQQQNGTSHTTTTTTTFSDNGTMDDSDRALYYFQKSRSIHERLTAVTYSNIGDAYVNKEDYDSALKYYHKCMDIRQREFGKDDPSTAMTYNNLSSVYYKIGEYDKSLEYGQRCFGIWESVYDETTHPHLEHTGDTDEEEEEEDYDEEDYGEEEDDENEDGYYDNEQYQ